MKSPAKIYVLDASAILDYLRNGPGVATIERVLREAFRHEATIMISVANFGEVFYSIWGLNGEQKARQMVDDLSLLPFQIVPVELPQALKAGEFKAVQKLPYADSMAAALAVAQKATLITSDRHFEKLGRRIPILWLPTR